MKVGVFTHEGKTHARYIAYVRDYNPSWVGCCEHEIDAQNGAEAKDKAIKEHKEECVKPSNVEHISNYKLEPHEILQKLDPRPTPEIIARLQEQIANCHYHTCLDCRRFGSGQWACDIQVCEKPADSTCVNHWRRKAEINDDCVAAAEDSLSKWKRRALAAEKRIEIAVNSCKDVTALQRFASSVDPVRWVEQLQAHLEATDGES